MSISTSGKPRSIGETLILSAAKKKKKIVDTMQREGFNNKIMKSVHLSDVTVSKIIEEMVVDVENKFFNSLKENNYLLRIDE